jgi:hypothetical protein
MNNKIVAALDSMSARPPSAFADATSARCAIGLARFALRSFIDDETQHLPKLRAAQRATSATSQPLPGLSKHAFAA